MKRAGTFGFLIILIAVSSCGSRDLIKGEGWAEAGSLDDLIHFVEVDPRVMTSAAHYRRAVDTLCQSKQCVQVAFFLPGDQIPPSGSRGEFFNRGGWKPYHPAAVFMGDDFTRWDCNRLSFSDAPASALCRQETSRGKSGRQPQSASHIDSRESRGGIHVAVGSERRQILNALRPAVESELKGPVEFVVETVKVADDWAFVVANPQRKGRIPIDGRAIFDDQFESMDGLRVDAVLRRQGGGWTLVEKGIGATDVWYCDVGPRSIKEGYGC